jgi:tetratricopeptide (TPR) repeat protein
MIYLNKKEQFDKAVATYERIVEKFPQSKYQAQSLFMVGYIYANHIKNFDKAKEHYGKFLEKYPEHELTASVQWEMQNLGKDISEIDILADSKDGENKTDGTASPATETAKSPKAKE